MLILINSLFSLLFGIIYLIHMSERRGAQRGRKWVEVLLSKPFVPLSCSCIWQRRHAHFPIRVEDRSNIPGSTGNLVSMVNLLLILGNVGLQMSRSVSCLLVWILSYSWTASQCGSASDQGGARLGATVVISISLLVGMAHLLFVIPAFVRLGSSHAEADGHVKAARV